MVIGVVAGADQKKCGENGDRVRDLEVDLEVADKVEAWRGRTKS